jgi:hypothetical protein
MTTMSMNEYERRVNVERRVNAEAAERARVRMAQKTLGTWPGLVHDVLADSSPGAAADMAPPVDSLFQKPAPLTAEQRLAIDRDLADIEAIKAGKVEAPLPEDPHVRAWLEQRRRADAIKERPEPPPPSGTRHWPRVRSPFARFGCRAHRCPSWPGDATEGGPRLGLAAGLLPLFSYHEYRKRTRAERPLQSR